MSGVNSVVPPHINAVIETCLYSDNLPRSAHFYQEMLGLRLLESGERLCVFSVADKQVLLIFRRGSTPAPMHIAGGVIPPHDAAGSLHIAFGISKSDFSSWQEHLPASGIAIESEVRWPMGGQSIYFRDPDNHLIELVTPGIWEVY
jgi:catechol 2,3-dioxygenase-like lactoylglutathione lyase family enzyme